MCALSRHTQSISEINLSERFNNFCSLLFSFLVLCRVVRQVRIALDNKTIFSCSDDGTTKKWTIAKGTRVKTLNVSQRSEYYSLVIVLCARLLININTELFMTCSFLTKIALSSDNKFLIAQFDNGSQQQWPLSDLLP